MIAVTRLLWLIAFDVSVLGLVALCQAMLPGLQARVGVRAATQPGRSLTIGAINVAFFGVISAVLLSRGGGVALLGGVLGTLLLCLIAVGLAAVARLIGERLRPQWDDPLRQVLVGALTLTLASSVPLVGWFVVLPLAGLIGCGAAIGALVRRGPVAADVPPVPPVWRPPQPPPPGGYPAGGSVGGGEPVG